MSRSREGTTIKSSAILRFRYDAEAGGIFVVQFKKPDGEPGPVWSYADVPVQKVRDFEASTSKGAYFHANIKKIHPAKHYPEGWPS